MNVEFDVSWPAMLSFGTVWFLLMSVTYGTNVPSGLFLPGMIVGCTIGDLTARLFLLLGLANDRGPNENFTGIKTEFVILACAAMLAGYTRMTYSLVIIMIETTQSLYLFVPILITILTANSVGNIFTRGLYMRACRGK